MQGAKVSPQSSTHTLIQGVKTAVRDRDRLPRPERRRFAAEAGEEDRWQLVNFADAVDAEVLVAAKVEDDAVRQKQNSRDLISCTCTRTRHLLHGVFLPTRYSYRYYYI